ncbi:hypothetical protein PGTUg99_034931 [Puccinia graminis f. sp. tritici]|uniref:Uncharacterized protein n=1 Tax=Puccinia graminis f. sp. tritici TaxID=56615 RepID=A0A5B0SEU7_PUCGR|nr:hypothetical protein PGTUg99_034931 [Puccinia graminis f. sp. tritici]
MTPQARLLALEATVNSIDAGGGLETLSWTCVFALSFASLNLTAPYNTGVLQGVPEAWGGGEVYSPVHCRSPWTFLDQGTVSGGAYILLLRLGEVPGGILVDLASREPNTSRHFLLWSALACEWPRGSHSEASVRLGLLASKRRWATWYRIICF